MERSLANLPAQGFLARSRSKRCASCCANWSAHTGKRPIIYTDITFHKDVLEGGEFADYPFWLRSVAAEPEERYVDRRWTFWQWTTTGRVPGVRGDVDRNVFNGSEKDWDEWLKRARVPRHKPQPLEEEATSSILPRGLLPF